LGTHTQFN